MRTAGRTVTGAATTDNSSGALQVSVTPTFNISDVVTSRTAPWLTSNTWSNTASTRPTDTVSGPVSGRPLRGPAPAWATSAKSNNATAWHAVHGTNAWVSAEQCNTFACTSKLKLNNLVSRARDRVTQSSRDCLPTAIIRGGSANSQPTLSCRPTRLKAQRGRACPQTPKGRDRDMLVNLAFLRTSQHDMP